MKLSRAFWSRTPLFSWLLRLIGGTLIALALAACGGGVPTQTQETSSYTVKMTLDALSVGDRAATIEVTDRSGQPVAAQQVILTPTMLAMGMASPQVTAAANGTGRYKGEKMLISMTGDWEIDVTVQSGSQSETARFLVTIPTQ